MRRVMRAVFAGGLMMAGSGAAQADTIPPFKGNDTGGIIAWPLSRQFDAKTLAADHCASYGKVARLRSVQPVYGGYISFGCVWVPPGRYERPLRVGY